MRRIASHYIFWRQLYRMSYIELADDNTFRGIFTLNAEIPGTEFYDGLLVAVNKLNKLNGLNRLNKLNQLNDWIEGIKESGITERVSVGDVVSLYRIHDGKLYTLLP